MHEVCLTCHWYAHSHGWLLLSLWLLVEHHSLRLELWHLLLLRGLLHHWEASGATSLTLSLSHTTAHHRRPLLLLHAESTAVSSHSSSSHATTHCTILLLAPNAVKSFRFLGKEQVCSCISLLSLKLTRIFLFQYLCLIFLHRIEIKE